MIHVVVVVSAALSCRLSKIPASIGCPDLVRAVSACCLLLLLLLLAVDSYCILTNDLWEDKQTCMLGERLGATRLSLLSILLLLIIIQRLLAAKAKAINPCKSYEERNANQNEESKCNATRREKEGVSG